MPSFLVNYGGPGPSMLSTREKQFSAILDACKKQYGGKPEGTAFTIKGLNLTYYEIGIHRMIKVECPDSVEQEAKSDNPLVRDPARETKRLYAKVRSRASDFNCHKYKLLAHNCVSSVANVLGVLDPDFLDGKNKIVPVALDKMVKEYVAEQRDVANAIAPQGHHFVDEDDIDIEFLQQGGVPKGIWDEAMTDTNALAKQQNMKAALEELKAKEQIADETPDEPTPTKSTP